MKLGTVVIHDPRLDIDRHHDITKLELRDGVLYLEAETIIRVAGSIEDSDVVSIHDPGGRLVTRYWLTLGHRGYELTEHDRFTLMLPISLGGPGGMADHSVRVRDGRSRPAASWPLCRFVSVSACLECQRITPLGWHHRGGVFPLRRPLPTTPRGGRTYGGSAGV